MINVYFYNNDLQVQFNDYEELKTYLESIEGQGLTIRGIDDIKENKKKPPTGMLMGAFLFVYSITKWEIFI